MARYDFTEQAETDLAAIVDFTLQRWGTLQANRYIDEMAEKLQVLADNPALGAERNLLAQGLLSFPHQSHVIYYLQKSDGIVIVRVLHASMDSSQQF